ncbi:MAG: VWA domain-containing protein [Gammaproteobacteria bacterium]
MLSFEWVWLVVLLPLPILVRFLFSSALKTQEAALKIPFSQEYRTHSVSSVTVSMRKPLLKVLMLLMWILLVFSAMRPQWLGDAIELPVSGRDLMLAVDLSGSMETADFELNGNMVDRLTATKHVAGQFIKRRVGDRIGLILFGTQAYLQVPLTFDRFTVNQLLNESALGLAGDNTAIGDAIGLAVKRLSKQSVDSRVLILLTDGANTAGEISPIKAAELAAVRKLKIYTIGVGADRMTIRSLFGSRTVNPSSALDEKTLKLIAESTGGKYYRAKNTEALQKIYEILDELEPIEKDKQTFRPMSELYMWPLSASYILVMLMLLIQYFPNLRNIKFKNNITTEKGLQND